MYFLWASLNTYNVINNYSKWYDAWWWEGGWWWGGGGYVRRKSVPPKLGGPTPPPPVSICPKEGRTMEEGGWEWGGSETAQEEPEPALDDDSLVWSLLSGGGSEEQDVVLRPFLWLLLLVLRGGNGGGGGTGAPGWNFFMCAFRLCRCIKNFVQSGQRRVSPWALASSWRSMCLWSRSAPVTKRRHSGHWCLFRARWSLTCCLRMSGRRNVFSHWGHRWDSSSFPCDFMWSASLSRREKRFPHSSQANIFSSEWTYMCRWSLSRRAKRLPHFSQTEPRSDLWEAAMWFIRRRSTVNDLEQAEHRQRAFVGVDGSPPPDEEEAGVGVPSASLLE